MNCVILHNACLAPGCMKYCSFFSTLLNWLTFCVCIDFNLTCLLSVYLNNEESGSCDKWMALPSLSGFCAVGIRWRFMITFACRSFLTYSHQWSDEKGKKLYSVILTKGSNFPDYNWHLRLCDGRRHSHSLIDPGIESASVTQIDSICLDLQSLDLKIFWAKSRDCPHTTSFVD